MGNRGLGNGDISTDRQLEKNDEDKKGGDRGKREEKSICISPENMSYLREMGGRRGGGRREERWVFFS